MARGIFFGMCLCVIVGVSVSSPVSALCQPDNAQLVVASLTPSSTLTYPCSESGCHTTWSRSGTPDLVIQWTVWNDQDDHVKVCTWDNTGSQCTPNHGGHVGHELHSRLEILSGTGTSELIWFPC